MLIWVAEGQSGSATIACADVVSNERVAAMMRGERICMGVWYRLVGRYGR